MVQNNDCNRKKRLQNNVNTYVSQPLARLVGAETETMPKKTKKQWDCPHHEGVLHSDDAAVQDGG